MGSAVQELPRDVFGGAQKGLVYCNYQLTFVQVWLGLCSLAYCQFFVSFWSGIV